MSLPARRGFKPIEGCPLTERELQIVYGISMGLTGARVASRLGLSENTVKTVLSRIYAKLEVGNQAAAVGVALRKRWIK